MASVVRGRTCSTGRGANSHISRYRQQYNQLQLRSRRAALSTRQPTPTKEVVRDLKHGNPPDHLDHLQLQQEQQERVAWLRTICSSCERERPNSGGARGGALGGAPVLPCPVFSLVAGGWDRQVRDTITAVFVEQEARGRRPAKTNALSRLCSASTPCCIERCCCLPLVARLRAASKTTTLDSTWS